MNKRQKKKFKKNFHKKKYCNSRIIKDTISVLEVLSKDYLLDGIGYTHWGMKDNGDVVILDM